MRLRLASACLFAALLTAPAGAQALPDDAPAWVFFVGNWTCTLSNTTIPLNVSYARKSPGLYTQHVSAQLPNGNAYTEEGWISYDGSTKHWVYLAEGATGDYTVATTPGWKEGVIVFESVLVTGGDTVKTTLKRVNDTTVDGTVVASAGTSTQHCTKK